MTLAQIGKDLCNHEMMWSKWMRQAAVEVGEKPRITRAESAENRELKKRIRLLTLENEGLRRAATSLSPANLPGKSPNRSWQSPQPTGSLSQ